MGAFVLARNCGDNRAPAKNYKTWPETLKVYGGEEKGHRTLGICSGGDPSLYSFPSGGLSENVSHCKQIAYA
jgi:hypothetical protein